MGDHDTDQRIRLVAMGGGGAGKTSIIKRFMFNTFDEKHRSTVEDLYYREYELGASSAGTIKVDILDTAGDLQFPAMRRLSIATANAFLLVYAVDSPSSFDSIKQCVHEIREHRPDFQEIPTVVVGNKSDVAHHGHLPENYVRKEDVAEWVYCELPRMRVKVLECSAKTSTNIMDVFRSFLHLARLLPKPGGEQGAAAAAGSGAGGGGGASLSGASLGAGGLKRRSSEYGGSGRADRRPSPSPMRGVGADNRQHSSDGLAGLEGHSTAQLQLQQQHLKPRSRSLIRRSSKKTSKLSSHGNVADECAPS